MGKMLGVGIIGVSAERGPGIDFVTMAATRRWDHDLQEWP